MKSDRFLPQLTTKLLEHHLKLTRSDSLLVLAPPAARPLADALYRAAESHCQEAMLAVATSLDTPRSFCIDKFRDMLRQFTAAVVIHPNVLPTSLTLWLKKAEITKIMCLAAPRPQKLRSWLQMKVNRIMERTLKIAELIDIGNELHISTAGGTDLRCSIQRRRGVADIGCIHGGSSVCSLPAGEVRIQPEPSSIVGKAVVDFVAGHEQNGRPAQLFIRDGCVTQIKAGNGTADLLRRLLRRSGKESRSVLEFSFGINEHLSFGSSCIEDRKALGGAGLTLGKRKFDSASCHLPICAIMLAPTVTIDGRPVLQSGTLVLK